MDRHLTGMWHHVGETVRGWHEPMHFLAWLAALAVLMQSPGARAGDEAVYLEQLRARGLHSVAEGYCLRRLSDERISGEERVILIVELSETFAEHAAFKTGEEQGELWNRAKSVVKEQLKKEPDGPWSLFLRARLPRVEAARGHQLRWQVELDPLDEALRQRARGTLDQAVSKLLAVHDEVVAAVGAAAARRGTVQDGPQAHEYRELRYELQLQIGETLLDLAHVLPERTVDRTQALIDAERWLSEAAGGDVAPQVKLRAKRLFAESSRLRGDLHNSRRIVSELQRTENASDAFEHSVYAEHLRLLLAEDREEQVPQELDTRRQAGRDITDEMLFLQTSALARLYQGDADSAEPSKDTVWARLESLPEQYEAPAGYWEVRGRKVMEELADVRRYGEEIAPLVIAARMHARNGRVDQAIESYREAASKSWRTERYDTAMELGYARASLLLKSDRVAEAASAFLSLAKSFPEHERTPPAHLLWAMCLGKQSQVEKTAKAKASYLEALRAHRREYLDSPTAHEAAWLLAVEEEGAGHWNQALELFLGIPRSHARGRQAVGGVARCYTALLELQSPSSDDWFEVAAAAEAALTPMLRSATTEVWSPEQAAAALVLARIWLERAPSDASRALQLLERVERTAAAAIAGTSPLPAWNQLRGRAMQFKIVALAQSGHPNEARAVLESVAVDSPVELLGLLEGLNRVERVGDASAAQALADLQLSTARKLESRRNELDASAQTRLDLLRAGAELAAGHVDQGLRRAKAIFGRSAGDRQVLQGLTEALAGCGDPACLTLEVRVWKRVESLEKPGTRSWLEARYEVCRLHGELGEFESARKLLEVTRLLYPELGGEQMRARFESLTFEER